jgi:hypothetical protein
MPIHNMKSLLNNGLVWRKGQGEDCGGGRELNVSLVVCAVVEGIHVRRVLRDYENDEDGEKHGFEEEDGVVVALRAAPARVTRVCEV